MPVNKKALIRYKAIDECLRNRGRRFNWEDLAEACARRLTDEGVQEPTVARRTIYKDLDFMRSENGYNAPIESIKVGRRSYYRYSDTGFSIFIKENALSDSDLKQIQSAVLTLQQFDGLPVFDWMEEILPKLSKGEEVSSLSKIILFEDNEFVRGKNWINPLFNAISERIVVDITYRNFEQEEPQFFRIHPYFLKQYNHRWYVFGYYAEQDHNFWVLALDRIEHIEAREDVTYRPSIYDDYQSRFEDIIGVSWMEDAPLTEIRLQISSDLQRYIETKPIHPSQTPLRLNGKAYHCKIRVKPNYELYQTLLAYGPGLEVLGPEHIRSQLQHKVNQMYLQYSSSSERTQENSK